MPSNSTKFPQTSVPAFCKYVSRDVEPIMAIAVKNNGPLKKDGHRGRLEPMTVYEPNWDYTQVNLKTCVPDFSRQCGREEAQLFDGTTAKME